MLPILFAPQIAGDFEEKLILLSNYNNGRIEVIVQGTFLLLLIIKIIKIIIIEIFVNKEILQSKQ